MTYAFNRVLFAENLVPYNIQDKFEREMKSEKKSDFFTLAPGCNERMLFAPCNPKVTIEDRLPIGFRKEDTDQIRSYGKGCHFYTKASDALSNGSKQWSSGKQVW